MTALAVTLTVDELEALAAALACSIAAAYCLGRAHGITETARLFQVRRADSEGKDRA